MTPNFALDLSEDGIELLHRSPDGKGWYREGRVAFASDDIAQGLADLRARAIELEDAHFQTKLILPKSQLLFMNLEPGADVAAALEARTPYRIDQLSFDTSQNDKGTNVVAVALETLGEAEGFIAPHGLNPVGFTAIPDAGTFSGEPMLGGTLAGEDSFVADSQAVRIIDKPSFLPDPVASVEPPASADADAQIETPPGPEPEAAKDDKIEDALPADDVQPVEKQDTKSAKSKASPVLDVPKAPEAKADSDNPTAAFSSRRRGSEDDVADDAGTHVKKLSARIAVPDTAPKLGGAKSAPLPDPTPPKPKAATAPKPVAKKVTPPKAAKAVPVVPPPMPARIKTAPPDAVAAELASGSDALAKLAANERRGKPRFLGLILTAILLVCLGLAAVLSSFVLPDNAVSRLFGRDAPEQTDVVQIQPAPDLIETPDAPLGEEIDLSSLPVEDELPGFETEFETDFETDRDIAIDETEPTQPELAPRPAEMTEAEAQTAYAVSGIWQRADTLSLEEATAETLDDLYVASLDPNPAFEDAPALIPQAIGGGETELVAFTRPPPPGIIFDIDERGLVRATPEGALNPDAILVYLGRPPVAALPRPGGETIAPDTPLAEAEPQAEPAITEERQRLAAIRPQQRPTDLEERQERATLGGLSRPELAQIRPTQRPISAQARAEAIARALLEADAQNQEDVEAALVAATRQAVSVSRRALPRPRNFTRIVNAARTTPRETPSAQVQTASASTASAARATGPAVARSSRVNPTGPVSARVARAATDSNVIALGKVALVGVFGTSSNRRALVRMPNGRFKKVSIGDRVDGGRVAAIDGNSLRYTKGGRTLTLQMPNS